MKTKLLLAIVIVALSGCSKSDSPTPSIVGSWKFVSAVQTACIDPADNRSIPCTTCPNVTFTASGTFTVGTSSGTYTLTGSKITITQSGASFTSTVTVTSTTLTIVQDKDLTTGCILTTSYSRV